MLKFFKGGSASSSPTLQITLAPQAQPVAAIDVRFCEPQPVTLQNKSHLLSGDLTLQDVHTGTTRFEVKGKLISSRQTLLDANGTPIVNYKDNTFSAKPVSYVYRGAEHDGAELLQIYADYHSRENTEVQVEFRDLLTGQKCELGLVGHWRRRDAFIWLDRGCNGKQEPVAKIYCPDGVSRQKYHLEIAANVDTALITLICAILVHKQSEGDGFISNVAVIAGA